MKHILNRCDKYTKNILNIDLVRAGAVRVCFYGLTNHFETENDLSADFLRAREYRLPMSLSWLELHKEDVLRDTLSQSKSI